MTDRMASKAGARVLLVLAFVAASIGYNAWIVTQTVLDNGATADVVHRVIQTPSVQASLRKQLDKALAQQLDYVPNNPAVQQAISNATRDPRVKAAFEAALVHLHRVLLSNRADTVTLDPTAMTEAMQQQLATYDPTLATQLQHASEPLQVQFDTDRLPRLDGVADAAHTATTLGLAAAILLIGASLMLQRDKKAVSRVGRRVAYLAIVPLLAFAVVPRLLDAWSASGAQVGAAALRGYSGRVMPSAIALIVIGVSTAVIAWVWIPQARRHSVDDAAAPRAQPADTVLPEKLYL
jgi:hypothetical protein